MKRKPMAKRKSKRLFKATANKVHTLNYKRPIMRGGIRL